MLSHSAPVPRDPRARPARTGSPALDPVPALGVETRALVLPRPLSSFYACLEQRELVGPRGEATHSTELLQLVEERYQRVVGRLVGEVVASAAPTSLS